MSGLKYRIQIPGKTFFFGEYAALIGGDSLLITTKPGFEIRFEQSQDATSNPFQVQSPAGKLFQKHVEYFSNWHIQFIDHYQGRGGFGASTAQFLGLGLFKRYFESMDPHLLRVNFKENIKSIWDEYIVLNDSGEVSTNYLETLAQLPSGYDLWAQALGSIVRVQRKMNFEFSKSEDLKSLDLFLNEEVHFSAQTQVWPFRQLEFLLVPTGFKVPTHEHLKDLTSISFANLKSLSALLTKDFADKKQSEFFARLNKWNQELDRLGLVHPNTTDLLKSIRAHAEILFSKGCGALGADVILLIFTPKDRSQVKTMLQSMGLNESYGPDDVWGQEVRVQS